MISGLAMGSIYVLTALGLYITHLTTNRVNFGQGDFMIAASYLVLTCRQGGLSLAPSVIAAVTGLGALGWLLERSAIRPLEGRSRASLGGFSWILTTAAFALVLQNVVELVYGKSAQYSPPIFATGRGIIRILGVGLMVEDLVVIGCATALVALLYWLMFRSSWGRRVQAVAFGAETAELLGINARRVKTAVFIIASVLAAAAGVLLGPMVTLSPQLGLMFTIKALIVAAIGGFANPLGILIGGAFFGVFEALSNYVDSSFGDLYPLLAALLVIAIRPSGIFGERVEDVR